MTKMGARVVVAPEDVQPSSSHSRAAAADLDAGA